KDVLYQLSYMGTLKSFVQSKYAKRQKTASPHFLSFENRGATGSLSFYGSDALQISNPTCPVNTIFN
ncbi:MAG: hypothetical protein ACLPRE_02790, partial [Limisphaerales bacterium]